MEIKEINELDKLLYDIKAKVIELCQLDTLSNDIKIIIMNDYLKLCDCFDELKNSIKLFLDKDE